MYPRTGCLWLGKDLVETFWIKSDHNLFADHQRRRGTALVLVNEIFDRLRVAANVTNFKRDPSLREVGLSPFAGRSTRLRKQQDGFAHVLIGIDPSS